MEEILHHPGSLNHLYFPVVRALRPVRGFPELTESMKSFPKLGYLFGGPYKKGCSIWGVYVGVLLLWETPMYLSSSSTCTDRPRV